MLHADDAVVASSMHVLEDVGVVDLAGSGFTSTGVVADLEVWDEILILRVDAPITFINIQNIKDYIDSAVNTNEKVKTLIIDGASISHIDASAVEVLNDLLNTLQNRNITVLMAELIGPVRDTLHQTGLLKAIGEKNIFLTLNDAVNKSNSSDYKHREAALQHNRSTL